LEKTDGKAQETERIKGPMTKKGQCDDEGRRKKSKGNRPKKQGIADKQVETTEKQRRIKKAKGWAQDERE